jgi:NNP family nitrate/nitrite transporter-like MFS transporter
MSMPIYGALALLTWKLSPAGMAWLTSQFALTAYVLIGIVYLYQAMQIVMINKEVFTKQTPDMFSYDFKQVALLDLGYMVTFGSELALVSMLPLLYVDMFGLSPVAAGLLAGVYPVMNLIARPGGGLMSDTVGRKKTLVILFACITVSFFVLGQISEAWAIPIVVVCTILCALCSQGGSGAVYAMAPLIQRRMTGQIAGMVGAYGNVGGLVFLTVLSFVSPQIFFMMIGGTAGVVLLLMALFLKEPTGKTAEILEDGTVQLIDVS